MPPLRVPIGEIVETHKPLLRRQSLKHTLGHFQRGHLHGRASAVTAVTAGGGGASGFHFGQRGERDQQTPHEAMQLVLFQAGSTTAGRDVQTKDPGQLVTFTPRRKYGEGLNIEQTEALVWVM